MPCGGAPPAGSMNRACSEKRPPATLQMRSMPGAVVFGEPSSNGGSRAAVLGRHTKSCGPDGAIVPATRAANVLPASNPWAVQSREPVVPSSSHAGAVSSNGSRNREVHGVVSLRQRPTRAAAARNARRGNGS